jgi:hypothetical protein
MCKKKEKKLLILSTFTKPRVIKQCISLQNISPFIKKMITLTPNITYYNEIDIFIF